MIETTCPCSRRIRVPRALRGRYVSCPTCGRFVLMDENHGPVAAPPDARLNHAGPGPTVPVPALDPSAPSSP